MQCLRSTLGHSQVRDAVLLTAVSLLYITASRRSLLITENVCPLTSIAPSPPPLEILLVFVLGELALPKLDSLVLFESALSRSFFVSVLLSPSRPLTQVVPPKEDLQPVPLPWMQRWPGT